MRANKVLQQEHLCVFCLLSVLEEKIRNMFGDNYLTLRYFLRCVVSGYLFECENKLIHAVSEGVFLHSPFFRAEGLCQHAASKGMGVTSNGPIREKQVNRSSSVIG